MDIGLFLMPLHPPEKPPSMSIAEDLELIVHADKLGFSEAWVGEHMTAKWEIIGSPDLFLSHAFAMTKDIRLGTGVYLLAVHHPSDVATRAALLDQISKGRFNFGVGTGSVPSDRPFKNVVDDAKVMNGRFTESLEIILGIWQAEPPWKYEGEYWTVELTDQWADLDMGFPLKPFTKPHPPIAIPGFSRDSGSIFEAGKRGWGALSTNLASNDIIGTHQSRYKQGMELDGGVFGHRAGEWPEKYTLLILIKKLWSMRSMARWARHFAGTCCLCVRRIFLTGLVFLRMIPASLTVM